MGKKSRDKIRVGDLAIEPDAPSRTLLVLEIKGGKAKVAPFLQGYPAKRHNAWLPLDGLKRLS